MIDYTNRIEKYLRGRMAYKEETNFKNDLKTNTVLRAQAHVISALVLSSRDSN